jgi:hypothetical protein
VGLLRTGINEVIATTAINAAPMGIHYRGGKATMVLFSGSHTAENIERDGWVIANYLHDPILYVTSAFEDLPRDRFVGEQVNGRTMQRLAGADAWTAFSATVGHKTKEAITVTLTPLKEIIEEVTLHPVNRGFGSIIDATVHATRYRINRDPELRNLIDYHASIVRKCGGKQELEALDLLMKYCG